MTRPFSTPAKRLVVIALVSLGVVALEQTNITSAAGWVRERLVGRTPAAITRLMGLPAPPRAGAAPLGSPPPAPIIGVVKSATITSDGGSVGKADPGDTIHYSVVVSNTGDADASNAQFTDTIDGHTALVPGSVVVSGLAVNDTYTTIGNTTLTSANLGTDCAANNKRSVSCNDTLNGATVLGFGPDTNNANATAAGNTGSSAHGTVLVNGDGTFVYTPNAGWEGSDSFFYTISNAAGTDKAQVTITITGMVWFLDTGAAACTTLAANCGRQSNPISSLSAFNTLNNGAGSNPAAGDTIFLFEDAIAYTGPVTLLANQKFIGQDQTSTVTLLGGPTLPSNGSGVGGTPTNGNAFAANAGGTVTITSAGDAIVLASGDTLAGFTVGTSAAANTAITGDTVGTLNVRDVVINSSGRALAITGSATVTNDATFTGFTSVTTTGGSLNAVLLANIGGTLALGSGAMSGATGATFAVLGGTGTITYAGNITHAAAGQALLTVGPAAGPTPHTGTITFSTGTLSATNGTGLQFNNADGAYNFNGTTTLNGGDAAVDITNGSGGTFTFGANTTITNPTGPCFVVDSSTVTVTYSGGITKDTNAPNANSAGRLVDITNEASGTITFQTGTLLSTSTAGTGIQLSNVDTTVNFNGTTTLNGGDSAIDIVSGSDGTFTFGSSTAITNPTGIAFNLNGSNASVNYAGSITANNGRAIEIDNHETNTVTFDTGTINGSGASASGIRVLNSNSGTININSQTNLSTQGNTAVDLGTNNAGVTVNFNPAGNGLDIATTTGTGFVAGGGTLTVTGAGNTINATTGTALIFTGTIIGTNNVTFNSTTSAGATTGVKLQSVTPAARTVALGSGSLAGTFLVGDGAGTANTGGTAIVTYGGTVTTTGATRAVDIQDRSAGAGNITLSGVISHASGNGTGIFLDGNAAGTITFSAASSVLNGGTSDAISLTGNTGATITFSGGGLDIDSTSGRGFAATGGGTLNVTGSNNDIDSTIGTALQVSNTTIGGSGLTFRKISSGTAAADSSANGIILDTTGANAGLTVVGTGAAGTGGIIRRKTGADGSTTQGTGIYLNNTRAISLDRMQLSDFQNYGVFGTNVTNFTMTNSVVNVVSNANNGTLQGGIGEGDVYFTGLSGSATITGSQFSGAVYDTFHVFNDGGQSLDRITITNSTFAMTNTTGNDALVFQATGGTFKATVQSSQMTAARGDLFQFNLLGTLTADLVFGGAGAANTLTNNNANIVSGGGGVTIGGGGGSNNVTFTYNISNNSMKGSHGAVLAVTKGFGGTGGNFSGTIDSNTIGTQGVALSGSTQGEGIAVYHDGLGTSSTTITNNHVSGVVAGRGAIDVYVHNGGNSQMTAVVQGNTIDTLDTANSFAGIYLQTGSIPGGGGDSNRSCLTIGGTTAGLKNSVDVGNNASGFIVSAVYIEQEGTSRVGIIGSPAFNNGGAPYNTTNVDTYVTARNNAPTGSNTGGATTAQSIRDVGSPAGGGYFGTCPPLMFTSGGVEAAAACPVPSKAAPRATVSSIEQRQLDAIGGAAIDRLAATGLTAAQRAMLKDLTLEFADLPDGYLAEVYGDRLLIDRDAVSRGWFVDGHPQSDDSFPRRVSPTLRYTEPSLPPAGRVDLLTTILHEMTHRLDYADTYKPADRDNLMYGYLAVGERRLPAMPATTTTTSFARLPFFALTRLGTIYHAFRLDTRTPVVAAVAPRAAVAPPRAAAVVPVAGSQRLVVQRVLAMLARVADAGDAFTASIPRPDRIVASAAQRWWTRGSRMTGVLMAGISKAFYAPVSASGETVNQSLGTIPVGKQITVVFDVTVDAGSRQQYSNTASVSGSNFGATPSNTVNTPGTLPTKLAITQVNGGSSPQAGVGFDVVVQAQQSDNAVGTVTQDTGVQLTLNTGNGTLGGTLTGTILSGQSQVTISGVTYTKAEANVRLNAVRTSGDTLTTGVSAAFTVVAGPFASYSLTPARVNTIVDVADRITIQAADQFGNPATGGSATVTITPRNPADTADNANVQIDADAGGPGGFGLAGATASVDVSSGTAQFDIKNAVAESFKIKANDGTFGGISPTITSYPLATTGQVIISEFRFRGPQGVADEYINLYNNTDAAIAVGTTDGSAGWAVAKPDGTLFTILNGVLLPARSYYLAVNNTGGGAGFSLGAFPAGTGTTVGDNGDIAYTTDIPSSGLNAGIALFNTATTLNFGASTRLDSVGYSTVTNTLFKEGTGLTAGGAEQTVNKQYVWMRNPIAGTPADTDDNATDFMGAAVDFSTVGTATRLGAPGPKSSASPVRSSLITVEPISGQPTTIRDNLGQDWAIPGGGTLNFPTGVLNVPKRFTNTTGHTITRLRVRIVDLTTAVASGTADMRVIDGTGTVFWKDSSHTLRTEVAFTPELKPMLVELPQMQVLGGGFNTTLMLNLSSLPGGNLANGATVDVHFRLGVKTAGSYRFYIMMEALP